jgi:hypothetical protein
MTPGVSCSGLSRRGSELDVPAGAQPDVRVVAFGGNVDAEGGGAACDVELGADGAAQPELLDVFAVEFEGRRPTIWPLVPAVVFSKR